MGYLFSSSFHALGLTFVLGWLSSGCATTEYLWQASRGQLALLNHARPIAEVIKDEKESPRVRKLLAEVPSIKAFGEKEGLKPTSNYQEYTRLDRPAAVWVVSAARPLEFVSKEWSFPVVGRFPYLGWFDLEKAKRFAKRLEEEGWEVDLRGATAYSTLGWFRDPILSSMISDGEEALGDLVNVVLHESVHATIYLKGQAYFNESVASFLADRLTEKFMSSRTAELESYLKAQSDSESRVQALHRTYDVLAKIYADSKQSQDEKLEKKKKIIEAVKVELGLKRNVNNAFLIQFKTYRTDSKAFQSVWTHCSESTQCFLKLMFSLKAEDFSKSQQEDLVPVLTRLIKVKSGS